MNPNTTIRPWIKACGKQFGLRHVFEYRWPDAETKPLEMYCTYKLKSSNPESDSISNLDSADGTTAVQKGSQSWLVEVVIDLHNSQNGIYELSSFCVALMNHQSIGALFDSNSTLLDSSVTDETDFDAFEIRYHHRLTCIFRENVVHSLEDANGVVETVRLQIDDGTYHDQYDVDNTGFAPTT